MPDRRRPSSRYKVNPTEPMPKAMLRPAIITAMEAGKLPLDSSAIASAIGESTARTHRALKAMRRDLKVRWINRAAGGPGWAFCRPA